MLVLFLKVIFYNKLCWESYNGKFSVVGGYGFMYLIDIFFLEDGKGNGVVFLKLVYDK